MTIVAVNKVVFGENVLIDLSGDDITAEKLLSGSTAHAADGSQITGSLPFTPSGNIRWYNNSESNPENVTATTVTRDGADYIRFKHKNTEDRAFTAGSTVALDMEVENVGDATAGDVMAGKTFTSAAGVKVTGTSVMVDTSDATAVANNIQNGKTAYVNGEKITGNIPYSTDLSVEYAGFNYTSSTQTFSAIGKGEGKLVIQPAVNVSDNKYVIRINDIPGESVFGDATAADVAKGKTFTSVNGRKITGTHECSGSGGSSNNNCEAYHITSASDVISFKGTGTVHVYGFAYYKRSTYSITQYSFVGDGYYTGSSYSTPTKTNATFSINPDGTLSGLPSSLTALDLLVVIGV